MTRSDREDVLQAVSGLEHAPTRTATDFERSFLETMGGGCSAPVGAIGLTYRGGLRGWALVASPDGRRFLKGDVTGNGSDSKGLGRNLADTLIARGALEVLAAGEMALQPGGNT